MNLRKHQTVQPKARESWLSPFCLVQSLAGTWAARFTVLLLVSCGAQPTAPPISPDAWKSPNLLVNRERIEVVKHGVARGDATLTAAHKDLVRTADDMLSAAPNPIVGELRVPGYYTAERETQQRITRQLRKDARTSNALALACALTGKAEYGTKAKQFLFAWVRSLTKPVNGGSWWQFYRLGCRGDTPLVIAYSFPCFIYAFDLLKGEGILTQDEIASFRTWLRPFVDYHLSEEIYKNNHHNWQVVFLMCAAHALEDPALFDRAVQYYHHGLRGQIRKDGALPHELWRKEKSGTYTLMALEAMTQAVHISANHGYTDLRELRSKDGGTLEAAIDFYTRFLDDPQTWATFTNTNQLNVPNDISDWGYIFELPYRWWGKEQYLTHMQKRPYGYDVERCYTLDFATLLFAQ